MVGPRWRWMTLAALLFVVITVRLGIWQLDRLAQRHAESARRAERLGAVPVQLTAARASSGVANLPIFQPVVVRGAFDSSQELAITNEIWDQQLGLHLLTPLVIEGSNTAVLVDRGWVPAPSPASIDLRPYRVDGPAEIAGWVRPLAHAAATISPAGGNTSARSASSAPKAEPASRLIPAFDAAAIQGRVTYPLLPFVIAQSPPMGSLVQQEHLPFQKLPETNLGDGVHLIAAAQWFAIACIIVAGQFLFVRRQLMRGSGSAVTPSPALGRGGCP